MALSDIQAAVRAATAKAAPSVVGIGRRGRGTGLVIEPGKVATNAHHIRGPSVTVSFSGGDQRTGTVLGVDQDTDLAVIDVDTGDAPPVTWADDLDTDLGAAVVALANPSGRALRATFGNISSSARTFRGPHGSIVGNAIEHSALLGRGSTGGPLVNEAGELVGINSLRRGDGFTLALPATDELRSRIQALSRGESPRRPRLGLAVAPPHIARRMRAAVGLDDREGLLVRDVDSDGPGDRAGIRAGDLIVAANGVEIASSDALFQVIEQLEADAPLSLRIVRGSEEIDVSVTFEPTREEGAA